MTVVDFLLPVFVLVFMTFVLHLLMARERIGSLKRGEVKASDIALRQPNWNQRATQLANSYSNQFELPVLFYVLTAFILITRTGDLLLLVLAWIFVALRVAHAYVHTTSNVLSARSAIHGGALVTLLAMWVVFAVKILTGV